MLRKVREEEIIGTKAAEIATELFQTQKEAKGINTDLANVDWEILDCVTLSRRMNEQRDDLTREFQE